MTIIIPFPVCPLSPGNVLFHNLNISQLTAGLQNCEQLNRFHGQRGPNVAAQFVPLFHLHKVACNTRCTHLYNVIQFDHLLITDLVPLAVFVYRTSKN